MLFPFIYFITSFSKTLIEWHFFIHFYLPFHFFKVSFDFAYLPKVAIFNAKVHRGTPEGGKASLLVFSNPTAIFKEFLLAIAFFESLFRICLPSKTSILQG